MAAVRRENRVEHAGSVSTQLAGRTILRALRSEANDTDAAFGRRVAAHA
jgi:hypothetical protein